jgi:plasmid stabilization system protein ParE
VKGASFNRLAERELLEAAQTYEDESPGLGGDFLDEVERGVSFLMRHPRGAPEVDKPVRQLVLARFPYSLMYRPLADGRIRILAIAHHRRRPRYWVDRR